MNRIAELRKQHDISQKELAAQLGIAQNTLSQYENEIRNPTTRVVLEIAKIFGVSANFVLGYPEKEQESIDSRTSISDVTKVLQTTVQGEVNALLSLGWRIIHVGTDGYQDGQQFRSETLFTLGWYGNSEDAPIPEFEPEGREYWELI